MTDPNQYNPQIPQPAPQYGQPDYGQTSQYNQQNYGQQAPQYVQQAPNHGQQNPAYGQPSYDQNYGQNYGQTPQYDTPNYGQQAPGYGQPTPQPMPAIQPPKDFFALSAPLDMPAYHCTMGEAIIRFFKKYAVFTGRASRSEFWWWFLSYFIINLVLNTVFGVMREIGDSAATNTITDVLSTAWALAVLVPSIALGVRRMHDINMSGAILAIVYAAQAISIILIFLGGGLFVSGAISTAIGGNDGGTSIGGGLMAAIGILAFIASGIVYIVLMAQKTNPEGARFDNPENAANIPNYNAGATVGDPHSAQAPQYAAPVSRYDSSVPQYGAPQYDVSQQYAAPAAERPASPAMPAVPEMPPMPSIPQMPATPQSPDQSQNPYGTNPADPNTQANGNGQQY